MGTITFISENDGLINKYKEISESKYFKFFVCKNIQQLSEISKNPTDIYIVDTKIPNYQEMTALINNFSENSQVLLLMENSVPEENLPQLIYGYIDTNYSEKMFLTVINSALKVKSRIDKLTTRNTDMAESLYRLNVLYNTSSQFAGTLDTKELLMYMIEGLDRSLSFDLSSTISFGFDNEPVLIINSLYDVSEELTNALKLRAILNYKSLFEGKEIPFEIDDTKLKIIKNIKNPHEKYGFSIFQYDNMFAPIDLGDQFFGCIEIFKKKPYSSDDAAYFQTIVRQVSLPLKSAGLYKEIKGKNTELEKLEHVKSNFISIVSHELRTPLTPLKNALYILSSGRCGELNENAVKYINMANRNVSDLTNIINDILDINKIEAGMMIFNFKNMNIHSVIENIKNDFVSVAKEHNINLSVNEQENLPEIYADSQRLEQIMKNLITNAIKFTPENKNIFITTELKNSDDIYLSRYFEDEIKSLKGDYIIVTVKDEGIGIKDEDILKIFEKFTQIENSLTRKVGGTGLGLPIAKHFIKAHKGLIWCDSEENKGSSFHVAIPVITEKAENKVVQKVLV